jgi:ATP-binding cassette subfamily B protein
MDKSLNTGNKLRTIVWGFKTAWKINKRDMLLWYGLSALLAILPAIALIFNKQSLSVISGFLSGGGYTFNDVVRPIISLGLLMVAIGLSNRVNADLITMMLNDSYFTGMYLLLMENTQKIDMTDLLKKDVNDAWSYSYLYAGSLLDFVSGACLIVAKFVSIISLLVVAFGTSKLIFAISLVYVVGIFFLSMSFTEKTRYTIQEDFQEERLIEYYEKVAENHGMAKETRVYENTEEIVKQWQKPFLRGQKRQRYRRFQGELRDFIGGAGFYIFLIITVGISILGVADGTTTPDVFLVLFTLCINLYNTITGTARGIYSFDLGLDGLDKQRNFFEIAPMHDPADDVGKADTPAEENTVFEVEDLKFSYADKPTIKGISFKVNKGEIVALVGANGSGKSTLVKLLLNMYKPDSGTIKFFGRTYGEYKRDFLRSKIGAFFQDFYIFHSSLRENVGVGAVEDMDNEAKIREAMRRGQAEKIAEQLPNKLDTLLLKFMDKSGYELSGGEKQRVASARTHMSNRDVLIFDEPASMLDPIAEMEQFNNIREMLDGRTAILISHRVGFARMASKVIMLNDGEIAETGTHDELMAQDGLYARFFNEQAQWYDTKGGAAE